MSSQSYLETEVLTASPQKLQLLLVEGAIRCCQRAKRAWEENDPATACDALMRGQEILQELVSSTSGKRNEIGDRLVSVYLFLFGRLTEALLKRDVARLDEVVGVLEVERETWRQVCAKFGASRVSDAGVAPHIHLDHSSPVSGGLCLDA